MPVDPQKSSQAHTEMNGHRFCVAASSITSHHQDSHPDCDLRDPQLVSCRGGDASQQANVIGVSRAERVQSVPVLQRRQLEHIFARSSAPSPLTTPPPTWLEIGVASLAVLALWLFLFALDGGFIR